jgi:predicted phage terminase large subunit-like protein
MIKKSVDDWLNGIDYSTDYEYVPSEFALEFINFIKLVNGEEGEEHKSPVIHYNMLDNIQGKKENIANMCSRGLAKTTLLGEYLFLYVATYGGISGFGEVNLAIYVSDSMENGVKNMRKNVEFRYDNSEFLKKYITSVKFTDARMEFVNANGKVLVVKMYGAKTGVRGAKEMGQRPTLAVLDDLVSDDDARSPTVIASIEDTVYKAVDYALHPTKKKTIWSGTPFNARDPLYKAVESGAWYVNVYPVCEQFPCAREDFKGAWGDRFSYDYVQSQYEKAVKSGKLDGFNQELMLRIMSDEERLIKDSDIVWYKRSMVLNNLGAYNLYITTDFATSEKESADFSTINVWALNNNGDWLWIDGYCKKALMNETIDALFSLAQKYRPQEVGIEVTGQQGGFISWIQSEMTNRNIYFALSNGKGSNTVGIRPTKDKMSRFQQNAVPLFKSHKIWLPEELQESEELTEMLNELSLATVKGFKSKHDDQIDNITMLAELNSWRPSELSVEVDETTGRSGGSIWGDDEDEDYGESSYFV